MLTSHSVLPLFPQYLRPPPPPPDQFFHTPLPPSQPPPPLPPPPQPSYDPFVDHQAGPAINPYQPPPSAQIPHPPWNGNPNFSKDYYGDSNHGLNYDSNGQIGVKRMRVDTLAEDERRLKLIRDHGAASHCIDRSYGGGYRFSNNSYEASNIVDKRANLEIVSRGLMVVIIKKLIHTLSKIMENANLRLSILKITIMWRWGDRLIIIVRVIWCRIKGYGNVSC
ncbi:UNVERIFIED_CONTAM: hypothetical protein Sradi_4006400 [Sesamum radiatum]|uniref:Uncharacterized protein n=1 Tax=Sesamum radiatum TaxID=300843 RepID=A0AAW2PHH0_SESRA